MLMPTFFIPHGGGPWPWMKEQTGGAYDALEGFLRALPGTLAAGPRAVLMVSAHWEEPRFTLQAKARPAMLYDYSGFPEHTYHVRYDAPGAPDLAKEALGLLQGAGIDVGLDHARDFDHGLFVPMALMVPDATLPVIQLSLKRGFDPREHVQAGRALAPLRDQGVLIVGSGYS